MSTISESELRIDGGKIFQRVKNGETIGVTDNGEIVATLIPPHASPFEKRLFAGRIRQAAPPGTFDLIGLERSKADESTIEP